MVRNLAKVFAAELEGIHANIIEVEVDLNAGISALTIVGLADKAIGEAKERVNSALKNSGVRPPDQENKRITINLAPADIKKTGSHYDLAIAIGYLLATKQVKEFETRKSIFLGELALDGRLRPITGALNVAQMAARNKFDSLYLPRENANEAAVINGVKVIPLGTLKELIDHLEGRSECPPHIFTHKKSDDLNGLNFEEIKGQENAKRALVIAAAGGHNLALIGPPGTGKSLLAHALAGILPALSLEESIEVTKIWSTVGLTRQGLITERPFRSPHQTASSVAIVGGGINPKPGEISLSHHGVLFLDELPEFQRSVLEALRSPLENGFVHIARARGTLIFPARFTLVAAMNPCPCGYFGDADKECTCGAYDIIRYQRKVSGPLWNRIDLQIRVPRLPLEVLRNKKSNNFESTNARKAILDVRAIQAERFKRHPNKNMLNSTMSSKETDQYIDLASNTEGFLQSLIAKTISPRGYYRLLKTARTIADLEGEVQVSVPHLAEAFSYRLREQD